MLPCVEKSVLVQKKYSYFIFPLSSSFGSPRIEDSCFSLFLCRDLFSHRQSPRRTISCENQHWFFSRERFLLSCLWSLSSLSGRWDNGITVGRQTTIWRVLLLQENESLGYSLCLAVWERHKTTVTILICIRVVEKIHPCLLEYFIESKI